MNTIEITNLQAISGGCNTCYNHQDKAERALYREGVSPTVVKEAMMSAGLFGGLAMLGAAAATGGLSLGAGIVGAGVAAYVFQHEYKGHELLI